MVFKHVSQFFTCKRCGAVQTGLTFAGSGWFDLVAIIIGTFVISFNRRWWVWAAVFIASYGFCLLVDTVFIRYINTYHDTRFECHRCGQAGALKGENRVHIEHFLYPSLRDLVVGIVYFLSVALVRLALLFV